MAADRLSRLSVQQRRELRAAKTRIERAWHELRTMLPAEHPIILKFEREYQALIEALGLVES